MLQGLEARATKKSLAFRQENERGKNFVGITQSFEKALAGSHMEGKTTTELNVVIFFLSDFRKKEVICLAKPLLKQPPNWQHKMAAGCFQLLPRSADPAYLPSALA